MQGGDDVLISNGRYNYGNLWMGDGDDSAELYGDQPGRDWFRFYLGSGHDSLIVGGNYFGNEVNVYGESGNDVIDL